MMGYIVGGIGLILSMESTSVGQSYLGVVMFVTATMMMR
jgi:hypothetical protein